MFLGWYDPDKKKATTVKVADAIARYQDKFGQMPTLILTSPQDVADASNSRYAAEFDISIEARRYIARHTFYVGQSADATPAVRGATA